MTEAPPQTFNSVDKNRRRTLKSTCLPRVFTVCLLCVRLHSRMRLVSRHLSCLGQPRPLERSGLGAGREHFFSRGGFRSRYIRDGTTGRVEIVFEPHRKWGSYVVRSM